MGNFFGKIIEAIIKGFIAALLGVAALITLIVPLWYVINGNIPWWVLIISVPLSVALFAGALGARKQ